MRLYLDVCCLNRLFDDQRQPRIRLEAEAVAMILDRVIAGQDQWLISPALEAEVNRAPDSDRRERIGKLIFEASEHIGWAADIEIRAKALVAQGVKPVDALHVAAAEHGQCDAFLTTDDRLLRRCRKIVPSLRVAIMNPTDWIAQILKP
jgi:predicted nucleic acid-binding protein